MDSIAFDQKPLPPKQTTFNENNDLPKPSKSSKILVTPNPFSPVVSISMPEQPGSIKGWNLVITDINGRIVSKSAIANSRHYVWNAAKQPSGVYLAVIEHGSRKFVQSLTLIR